MKRITIKDLAKMLSLSPSTISRALSDHPDISDKTKQRVKETAETYNYSVNLHSSLFRNKKSNLIALIIPELNMFYIPSMINAINDYLHSTEYSLFVFISKDKLKREIEIVKQCMKWAVEGILISPSSETRNLDHLSRVNQVGIKTVVLDKILRNNQLHSVSINNTDTAFSAVEYLINKGHHNILGIFGNPNISITKERIIGYTQAHEAEGLECQSENIITIHSIKELDSILPVILNHNDNISAIFSMSDEILANVYFHVMKFGKSIPDDISLIAISDGTYPHLTFPKVTYIRDSGKKMGKKACDLLLKLIKSDEEIEIKHLELSTKLVESNSVSQIEQVAFGEKGKWVL